MGAKVTSNGEYANSLLQLIFNNASSPNWQLLVAATSLYVSLHTASPTATGDQTSNEAAYTGYARVAIARSSSGWTVTGNQVVPAANIVFPLATGGNETETYFGIGLSATGAGHLMYFGALNPTIVVSNGVIPQVLNSSMITES